MLTCIISELDEIVLKHSRVFTLDIYLEWGATKRSTEAKKIVV